MKVYDNILDLLEVFSKYAAEELENEPEEVEEEPSIAEDEKAVLEEDWNQIQNKINQIENDFMEGVRKSVSKVTDISKTRIILDKKTKESTFKKYLRKNRSITTFTDLLRATVIVSSKLDLNIIVDGLKYYFDVVKKEHKESTPEHPYGDAIHVDVLVDGFVCEIQIMNRQTYRYKQEADRIYKSRLSEQEKAKKQKKYFDRSNMLSKIIRKTYTLSNILYKMSIETRGSSDI